jgi:hypothetical protein
MKLELLQHAGKIAGYNLVPENPAEESVLKVIAKVYSEAGINIDDKAGFYPACGTESSRLQFIRQEYEPYDVKTLIKFSEITVEEVREEPEGYLVCAKCGSKNVQVKAWVYPNDNNSYAGEVDDDAWCEDCDEQVYLNLVKPKKRKRKKNE